MASQPDIAQAAQALRAGELVALPTETVYGLGADARNGKAVAEIFTRKGRPSFNPLIVHFASPEAAAAEVTFDARAEKLAQRFWPGPLTLVLPRRPESGISLLVSAGLDSIAVRVPVHPVAQSLLHEAGIPIAAPSANRSGRISPTTPAHVRSEFPDCLFILDGGACAIGLESTVLALTGHAPVLLRPGSITREELENALQEAVLLPTDDATIAAPGMLASHYAPSLPLRLNATSVRPTEALLAYGPNALSGAAFTLNLSREGELREAASHLFDYLRRLDRPDYASIAAMPIPEHGIGIAINDRLRRAAAPRK